MFCYSNKLGHKWLSLWVFAELLCPDKHAHFPSVLIPARTPSHLPPEHDVIFCSKLKREGNPCFLRDRYPPQHRGCTCTERFYTCAHVAFTPSLCAGWNNRGIPVLGSDSSWWRAGKLLEQGYQPIPTAGPVWKGFSQASLHFQPGHEVSGWPRGWSCFCLMLRAPLPPTQL